MNKKLNGIAASAGIVIAKAYKLEDVNLEFTPLVEIDVQEEIAKFERALTDSVDQLDEIKQAAVLKLGQEEAEVFEAHKTILTDPELRTQVEASINNSVDAATSAKNVTDSFVQMFEMMDDEYFKARAADVKDVRKRLIANILGLKIPNLTTIKDEVIIIAEDLTPSETSQLDINYTKGFITNIGGRTSHAAIMARSMEIPAVVGTGSILDVANDGDMIILDAISGEIIVNPTEEQLTDAKDKIEQYQAQIEIQRQYMGKDSVSKDGCQVELVANIGTPNDVDGVLSNDGEGVGLYRTEFLYMDSKEFPSEEVQFAAYKEVLERMGKRPVVVRTLDIGGDKNLSYYKFPEEMNPFLGYRAIRFCLANPEIFRVQLRALLRASVFGNLKIMFPMIATLQEFRDAKALLFEEKANLLAEGIAVSDDIEVGIMVEIPSTAMMADTFAKEVDFFSIGTNDLIQYTMACDRLNENISYLYQPYNPAILRMVKNVVDAAKKHNKWAGMCGEMASDPIAIVALLGIGLHEFSMSASAILPARMQIAGLSQAEIAQHVDTMLDLSTADEVEAYIRNNFMEAK